MIWFRLFLLGAFLPLPLWAQDAVPASEPPVTEPAPPPSATEAPAPAPEPAPVVPPEPAPAAAEPAPAPSSPAEPEVPPPAPTSIERLDLSVWAGQPVEAVDWTPAGELVLAGPGGVLRGGKQPDGSLQWRAFWEDGLDVPGAVLLQNERTALVLQGPELTRLLDTDKDGKAEVSEAVFSGWGLNVAPADLATAPRALFRSDGRTLLAFASGAGHWVDRFPVALASPKEGQISWTPRWAGCLVLLEKDGVTADVVAVGFHRVAALASGPEGQIFVLDTLSPWGAPAIYQLETRGYYGNPESFPQLPPAPPEPKKKGAGKPQPAVIRAAFPVALLPPAVCAKPSSLAWVKLPDSGAAGDLIVGDAAGGHLARVRLSGPGDRLQGSAGTWLSAPELGEGVLSLAASPDGDALLAGLKDGAAVVRPGGPAAPGFEVTLLDARAGWVECAFSQPLSAETLAKAAEVPLGVWPLDSMKGPGELQVLRAERHVIEPDGYGIAWKLPDSVPLQALLAADLKGFLAEGGAPLAVTQFYLPYRMEMPDEPGSPPAPPEGGNEDKDKDAGEASEDPSKKTRG